MPRELAASVLVLALASACGGGQAQAPAPAVPEPPARQATGIDPFALPEGPRDPEEPRPELPLLRLEAWEKATKVNGVPAPPASCAAAPEDAAPDAVIALALAAPPECADRAVDAYLKRKAHVGAPDLHVLVGLSLAGKLARTGAGMPVMKDTRDKEKVKAFIQGPLVQWLVPQTQAIESLSHGAAGLGGVARGIAAIEAGIAELRLVDSIRSAPIPSTWDAELKSVYEIALDEALEPRKKRGRDAALVGLSDFADAGVLGGDRVTRARALLSKLYGGRRIDALDALILPAWTPPQAPPIQHEMPEAWRKDARVRFELGRLYWRRVDFVEAAYAAKASGDRLLLALSLALAKGPNGAKEMMTTTPSALGLDHTEALDALVAEGGKDAGAAAFDAAHLRSLAIPEGRDALPYLQDLVERFRKAAALLDDPAQKKRAEERMREASDLANEAMAKGPS